MNDRTNVFTAKRPSSRRPFPNRQEFPGGGTRSCGKAFPPTPLASSSPRDPASCLRARSRPRPGSSPARCASHRHSRRSCSNEASPARALATVTTRCPGVIPCPNSRTMARRRRRTRLRTTAPPTLLEVTKPNREGTAGSDSEGSSIRLHASTRKAPAWDRPDSRTVRNSAPAVILRLRGNFMPVPPERAIRRGSPSAPSTTAGRPPRKEKRRCRDLLPAGSRRKGRSVACQRQPDPTRGRRRAGSRREFPCGQGHGEASGHCRSGRPGRRPDQRAPAWRA